MTIKSELKQLKTEMDNLYKETAEQSRAAYLKSLAPGSPLPQPGKIYGAEYQLKFRDKAADIRNAAYSKIKAEKETLLKAMTAPASNEAINACSLLRMTSDATIDDVGNLLTKYGSNYSTYRAIMSIAKDNGVKGVQETFGPHKYDRQREGLEYLEKRISESFSPTRYEREGVQAASTLAWSTMIEQELTE